MFSSFDFRHFKHSSMVEDFALDISPVPTCWALGNYLLFGKLLT